MLIESGRSKLLRTAGLVGSSAVDGEDLRAKITRLTANRRAMTPRSRGISRVLPEDGK
jgi:hypothetical protein